MDGRLAPEVLEVPVLVDGDLLPVYGEQERWVARVVLADITGHVTPHKAHAQGLSLDIRLGKLARIRFLIGQSDSQRATTLDRFDDPPPLPDFGRHSYTMPGEDRCCALFVCADRRVHAPAPDVMGELFEEVGIPEEEVIRRNNQSHIAPGSESPDLALDIGPLRHHEIVAASLKAPADRGEHGGTFWRKVRVIAYGVFGEKCLHRSKGWPTNI